MTVLGAGLCPAGTSVAGYGVPTVATLLSRIPFPDPVTGLPQSGYQVGVASGDYSFTTDGRLVGCGTVKSLVEHACLTLFGSSAVPGFGLQLPGGDKGTGYSKRVTARLTSTLSALVAQRIISIVSIVVQDAPNNPSGTIGSLTWRDLTAPSPAALNGGAPSNEYTTRF